MGTTVAGDGTFRMTGLAPGDYKLSVRTTVDIGGTAVQEGAGVQITVAGVDIDNLALITSSGWSVTGALYTASGEPVPAAVRAGARVVPRPQSSDGIPMGPNPTATPDNGRVTETATFTVTGVYGPARLRVNLPDDWAVQSIQRDGRDITDETIEARSGETLGNVQVVINNKINVVSGRVTDAKGAATGNGAVIVFAEDAGRWLEDSRYVRSARPDQQGTFQIKGLPAGEYLAVALEYVEDGAWNDPEYLDSIRPYGQRVKLLDSGSQTIALELISPQ